MASRHPGEIYTPTEIPAEHPKCAFCNRPMDGPEEANGPTSWAESMAKGKHPYFRYTCPDFDKDWHIQVRQIRSYLERSPSAVLDKLLLEEIDLILNTRIPTKKVNIYF